MSTTMLFRNALAGSMAGVLLNVFCIPINERRTRIMTVRRIKSASDVSDQSRYSSGADHRILDDDRGIV